MCCYLFGEELRNNILSYSPVKIKNHQEKNVTKLYLVPLEPQRPLVCRFINSSYLRESVVHLQRLNFNISSGAKSMSVSIGLCLFQLVYVCFNWSMSVSIGLCLFQLVYVCFNWSMSVSIGLCLFQLVYVCFNWSMSVPIGLCLFQLVYVCSNWSMSVSIGLCLFQLVYVCFNWSMSVFNWSMSVSIGLCLFQLVLIYSLLISTPIHMDTSQLN